jgi:hypothetical protein
MVKVPDAFTLDRKIHAAGWNFFFRAAEVPMCPVRSVTYVSGRSSVT